MRYTASSPRTECAPTRATSCTTITLGGPPNGTSTEAPTSIQFPSSLFSDVWFQIAKTRSFISNATSQRSVVSSPSPPVIAYGLGPSSQVKASVADGAALIRQLQRGDGWKLPSRLDHGADPLGCACRKLTPGISVMESAQDWATKNVSGTIDGARDWCILFQG